VCVRAHTHTMYFNPCPNHQLCKSKLWKGKTLEMSCLKLYETWKKKNKLKTQSKLSTAYWICKAYSTGQNVNVWFQSTALYLVKTTKNTKKLLLE
jgi:hypothetical protein